jgi:hypothetical protein
MSLNVPIMLLVFELIFLLSGCQEGQDRTEVDAPPKPVNEREVSTLVADETINSRAVDMKSQVKKAINDLAGRLDVPLNGIEAVRVESVTWRDGSLGCPKKGMSYTQALVPGMLIVLRADDAEYEYHSGRGRDPFYCTSPQLPASVTTAE